MAPDIGEWAIAGSCGRTLLPDACKILVKGRHVDHLAGVVTLGLKAALLATATLQRAHHDGAPGRQRLQPQLHALQQCIAETSVLSAMLDPCAQAQLLCKVQLMWLTTAGPSQELKGAQHFHPHAV